MAPTIANPDQAPDYTVYVRCLNCQSDSALAVPFGTKVFNFLKPTMTCNYCGCSPLVTKP
jgi:hypothetical protein